MFRVEESKIQKEFLVVYETPFFDTVYSPSQDTKERETLEPRHSGVV